MGEGRRPEIVLTLAENSLQHFISSAWRRRMDAVRETRTCMVMGTAAPKAAPAHTPNPARSSHLVYPSASGPLRLVLIGGGGGGADGVKVKTGKICPSSPSHTQWRPGDLMESS